ncbi:MAG TPA: carboxypeptidase-like regulatory domain-containing protein [Pyrinomonadaceae bacterium]
MLRLNFFLTLILTVCLVLTLAGLLNAQQATPSPSDDPRVGTISGTVVNESGQPLIGATISVRAVGPSIIGRTSSTDSEGHFEVKGLDSSLYFVQAFSPAYVAPPLEVDTQAPTYRVGDTVKLVLMRGAVITGTVTTASGEPMVAVRVRAFMVRDASGKLTKGAVFSLGERATDDRGIYRIFGLAPGTYVVQAGGGGPRPGMSITDMDAPTFAPSSTRDTATEVQVRSGEEATVDIRYRGEPGHSISGTVKTQGPGGASVSITRVGDGLMATNGSFQAPGSKGFAIYGLADGDYEITAQETMTPRLMSFPELAFSDPLRVTVRGADVSGLELVPKPLASITGKVALESSKLPECQNKRQPLFSETLITLLINRKDAEIDQSALIRSVMSVTSPDKDGAFTLRNLRHGQYAFSPRFFGRYWYLKGISLPLTAAQANAAKQITSSKDVVKSWTRVKSGDRLTGLTITLAEGAASIRGELSVDQDKKLEPGFSIYLTPSERDKAEDPLRYFTQQVSDDGTFLLTGIPPGHYWVIAQQPQPDSPTTTEKLRLPDALDMRTKIRRAAESAKVEVELKPCQNLTDYKIKL